MKEKIKEEIKEEMKSVGLFEMVKEGSNEQNMVEYDFVNTKKKIEEKMEFNNKLLEESREKEANVTEKMLEKQFPETYKEDEKQKEWERKMGDNLKYAEKLKQTRYKFNYRGLSVYTDYGGFKDFSNVLVVPVKQINIISKENKETFIELKAILNTGEELPTIKVPIEKIEQNNFYTNSEWGLKVRFNIEENNIYQKDTIKYLAQDIEEETIFNFMGEYKLNGKYIYLHKGGAINTEKNIKVDLEDEILNRFKFTEEEFEIKEAIKVSLFVPKVAPLEISLPIFATNFLAPLVGIFDDIGIGIGFLTWIYGPPESKKTSLVSAINSHFGNFNRVNSPLSFLDGVPSIIDKCSKLNSVAVLIDDYYPSTNKEEEKQMNKAVDVVIRISYDRTSGSRSKSNGKMRKNPKQTVMIIGTGEKIPQISESRMSRVMCIGINKDDVNCENLTYIQKHAEEMQYTMKNYIADLYTDIDNTKEKIKGIYYDRRKEATKELSNRTSEIVSSLYVGYKMFLDFAKSKDVITEEEKEEMLNKGWQVLLSLGKQQKEEVEKLSSLNMILSAVELLSSIRKIFVVDMKSAPYMKKDEIYKNGFIGYYDSTRKAYCVYPDLLYKYVRNFYTQQGVNFPINKATMCKELFINDKLYKTEKQDRPQLRIDNPITGKEQSVIAILEKEIYIPCKYNKNGKIEER